MPYGWTRSATSVWSRRVSSVAVARTPRPARSRFVPRPLPRELVAITLADRRLGLVPRLSMRMSWQRRVMPEQVTINIGEGAKVPPPPPGHKYVATCVHHHHHVCTSSAIV